MRKGVVKVLLEGAMKGVVNLMMESIKGSYKRKVKGVMEGAAKETPEVLKKKAVE